MIIEKKHIKEYLQKTTCYKCGASLEGAQLETITEAPLALVAYAVCSKCRAESMITITAGGSGTTPLLTDLNAGEFRKFMSLKSVGYEELLELHKILKKTNLCSLLHKKEKNSVKKLTA